jgi:hypothetical protein
MVLWSVSVVDICGLVRVVILECRIIGGLEGRLQDKDGCSTAITWGIYLWKNRRGLSNTPEWVHNRDLWCRVCGDF